MNVLDKIYKQLSVYDERITQRRFSKEICGKNPTYLAYLRANEIDASADAILRCWGNLSKSQLIYKKRLQENPNHPAKVMLEEYADLYGDLGDQAFQALRELAFR